MEDQELLALYVARDEQAIRQTEEQYGALCHRIAKGILDSDEDAEECVNDTWLAVWNQIPPAKPEHFSAYLLRITRNLAVSRWRARNAEKRGGKDFLLSLEELEACSPGIAERNTEQDGAWLGQLLNAFLAELPRQTRQVFVRRYYFSEPIADIAVRFGMKESRIKSMLFRTRYKLKHYLEKEGYSV